MSTNRQRRVQRPARAPDKETTRESFRQKELDQWRAKRSKPTRPKPPDTTGKETRRKKQD